MSTIDLFACATGAFILLTLTLLPYYLNVDRSILDVIARLESDLAQTQEQLQKAQLQQLRSQQQLQQSQEQLLRSQVVAESCDVNLAQTRRNNERLQNEIDDFRRSLNAARADVQQLQQAVDACGQIEQMSFMLVLMSWETTDDIDLHIVDPNGERFYYNDRSSNASIATFEEDSIRGPANEIWMHPAAEPGEYKVYYNFYRRTSRGPIRVRGSIFHQLGQTDINEVQLSEPTGDGFENAPLVATILMDSEGGITVR
jgi:hypothetical protein